MLNLQITTIPIIFALSNIWQFHFSNSTIMDIISRIKEYMEYTQLTSSQFADRAGIPRPTLSQLLNGRNKSNEGAKKISSDIIRKLHDAFPDLNVMWLLFGDGDMESGSNIEISEPQNEALNDTKIFQNSEIENIQRHIFFDDEFQDLGAEKSDNANSASENEKSGVTGTTHAISAAASISERRNGDPVAFRSDKTKKVQSIMVFYSDNSFEIFKPSE